MTGIPQSDPMKNLVMVVIGLAILGAVIAIAWYFTMELPVQHAAILPPANY